MWNRLLNQLNQLFSYAVFTILYLIIYKFFNSMEIWLYFHYLKGGKKSGVSQSNTPAKTHKMKSQKAIQPRNIFIRLILLTE